ncbi:MAG: antibiotic biosynthesis monooxygenase [Chitinophagia bacterium]|nr:antibiotic biosynthesis monooxygenase [Chitinophagia bacterium]
MIIRIVKMHFHSENVGTFTQLFEERKSTIRNFPGCQHLELWQDGHEPDTFFTYSHWASEKDLDHYRFSEFFKDTWSRTKALFSAPPQAWSVVRKQVAE